MTRARIVAHELGVRPHGDAQFLFRHLSFAVHPGQSIVVSGPSGVGKSTLLRVLVGLLVPDEGRVTIDGQDPGVSRVGPPLHLGLTLGEPRLWPWMRTVSAVRTAAGLRGQDVTRREADRVLAEVGLIGVSRRRIRRLSEGMARRAQLATAFVGDPTLLILDEPTASLDREAAAGIWRAVERRRSCGATVIVASHDQHWPDFLQADPVVLAGPVAP